jgi:hypothetical protein
MPNRPQHGMWKLLMPWLGLQSWWLSTS